MLTQCLDQHNWLVGFITRWVDELACHVDALDVITLELGDYTPPPHVRVYSMGKELGRGRVGLTLGFYRAFIPLLRQTDAIFVHMIPRYALLAAPLALAARKPMTLWYTHRHAGLELKLATAACWRVLTAGPGSFPLETPKLRVMGHGIDTSFFAPGGADGVDSAHPAVVLVGRLMAVKHQATLIRALAQLAGDIKAQAILIGAVPAGEDPAYVENLKRLAEDLGIASQVTFTGALTPPEVRDWYRRAAVAVNLSPVGLFDKAALESMATGTPTIVSNPAFDWLLGDYASQLRVSAPDDVDGLAARVQGLLALSPDERGMMTGAIRARVVASHSLERLIPPLVKVLETGEPE